jgi:cytochrome c
MGSNMSSKWRAGSRKTKATCMPRNYPAQFRRRVIALGTILLCASELAFAQSPAERRGLRLVSLNCARCHAIDKVSKSPLAIAPPFRTLHLKYPVSDLQRPLAQGVHPIMPRFQLDASQVEDIMAYLKTLER